MLYNFTENQKYVNFGILEYIALLEPSLRRAPSKWDRTEYFVDDTRKFYTDSATNALPDEFFQKKSCA